MTLTVDEVLSFWIGELDSNGQVPDSVSKRWFAKNDEFDQLMTTKFEMHLDAALNGGFDEWAMTNEGQVALIILLDQFPRNIYRNQPKSFAFDSKAIGVAAAFTKDEAFAKSPVFYRYFGLMPFMHSEDLQTQKTGMTYFEALKNDSPEQFKPLLVKVYESAVAHYDIVAKYGRFPHRNKILERESTAEEIEFLKQPGSSF